MAIFQCDLLKNSKNSCIAIATELFFVFFRREKNKHNGASYLFSFTRLYLGIFCMHGTFVFFR